MLKSDNDIILTLVIGTILLCTLSFAIIVAIVLYKKKQKKIQLENRQLQSQHQQALLQTQIEIQEQTLKTISQEIHDNIGQVLSLAKLNLGTLQYGETEKLNDTKNLVSKAINDLRDLSRSLHGDKIAELGLHDAVENELKILQNTGQFTTTFSAEGEKYKLTPQKEMVLFRIVQEALHNAVKHSKGNNLKVQFNYQPDIFKLTIADDGIGFAPATLLAAQRGIGLKSMQSRAELIGAIFNIESAENSGTLISIALPNTV